jgi:hypothetical protein
MPPTGRNRIRRLPDSVRAGAVHVAPARAVELLYFDGCPHYEALLLRLPSFCEKPTQATTSNCGGFPTSAQLGASASLAPLRCEWTGRTSSPAHASATTSASNAGSTPPTTGCAPCHSTNGCSTPSRGPQPESLSQRRRRRRTLQPARTCHKEMAVDPSRVLLEEYLRPPDKQLAQSVSSEWNGRFGAADSTVCCRQTARSAGQRQRVCTLPRSRRSCRASGFAMAPHRRGGRHCAGRPRPRSRHRRSRSRG